MVNPWLKYAGPPRPKYLDYQLKKEEFIMTNFYTKLNEAFAKALATAGITIEDYKIDLVKVFSYTKLSDAKDILKDIVNNAIEDNKDLKEQFDNLTVNNIYNILFDIVGDDYIIGDWNSTTDQHEYTPDTQNIITEETGIEF